MPIIASCSPHSGLMSFWWQGVYAERGAAVLCTSLSDLEAIKTAADESGRVVSLLLETRGYPETVAARSLLDSGELGSLAMVATSGPHKLHRDARPSWFLRRPTYGGIIEDLAVHDIDLVLWLSGATEDAVSTVSDTSDYPLHGAVLLRAGDVAAAIEVSWLPRPPRLGTATTACGLTGTSGTAELLWARGELTAVTHTVVLNGL